MEIVSVTAANLGVLALVSLFVTGRWFGIPVGLGCFVIAIVTGFVSRSQRLGLAGLMLGTVGVVFYVGLFARTARSGPSSAEQPAVEQPHAAVPAASP
jgi:hypothetical protein